MLTIVEGLNGEGKSFFASLLLYKEWKSGAKIYTNFPLTFSDDNENIVNWHLLQELYGLSNGIIAIDEAGKLFHKRRWQSTPMQFIEMITQHRKQFLDVITTTPSIMEIDSEIRDKIHERYICQSLFRFPRNQRQHPILQWIRVIKKVRVMRDNFDRAKWQRVGRAQWFFLSRYWTKKLYETYAKVGLSKFVCQIEYKIKTRQSPAQWLVNITDRELINAGRARK